MSSPTPLIALLLTAAGLLLAGAFAVVPLAAVSAPENPIVGAALLVSLPLLASLLALAIPAGLGTRISPK